MVVLLYGTGVLFRKIIKETKVFIIVILSFSHCPHFRYQGPLDFLILFSGKVI